eukprot:scaffold1887_cov239-Pinguiococcus_pyrenoidosus.AAC.7
MDARSSFHCEHANWELRLGNTLGRRWLTNAAPCVQKRNQTRVTGLGLSQATATRRSLVGIIALSCGLNCIAAVDHLVAVAHSLPGVVSGSYLLQQDEAAQPLLLHASVLGKRKGSRQHSAQTRLVKIVQKEGMKESNCLSSIAGSDDGATEPPFLLGHEREAVKQRLSALQTPARSHHKRTAEKAQAAGLMCARIRFSTALSRGGSDGSCVEKEVVRIEGLSVNYAVDGILAAAAAGSPNLCTASGLVNNCWALRRRTSPHRCGHTCKRQRRQRKRDQQVPTRHWFEAVATHRYCARSSKVVVVICGHTLGSTDYACENGPTFRKSRAEKRRIFARASGDQRGQRMFENT